MTNITQTTDWWIWFLIAGAVIMLIIGLIFLILEFPGLCDCPCLYKDIQPRKDGTEMQENRLTGNKRMKKFREKKETPMGRLHRTVSRKISKKWEEDEGMVHFVRKMSQRMKREDGPEGEQWMGRKSREGGRRRTREGQRKLRKEDDILEEEDANGKGTEEVNDEKSGKVGDVVVEIADEENACKTEGSNVGDVARDFVRRFSRRSRRNTENDTVNEQEGNTEECGETKKSHGSNDFNDFVRTFSMKGKRPSKEEDTLTLENENDEKEDKKPAGGRFRRISENWAGKKDSDNVDEEDEGMYTDEDGDMKMIKKKKKKGVKFVVNKDRKRSKEDSGRKRRNGHTELFPTVSVHGENIREEDGLEGDDIKRGIITTESESEYKKHTMPDIVIETGHSRTVL